MKVLFYINTIGHGGAERVIVNLANNFSIKGCEAVLVTSAHSSWEYPHSDSVKRINLSTSRIKGSFKRNFFLIKELRRVIKEEKPDTVVSFMAEPNFRMLLATIGLKCKKVISIRNDPNREYPNFVFRFLAKTLYNLADSIVFQTKDAQRWFPKSIQKKSQIIMNQVDDIFFNTPLEEDRHNIVTTGRLTSQKNHKMLIHAFAKIANQIDDNLIIYGEGELRGELESLAKELGLDGRVLLPGATKNVPEVLSKAKLFVLSSDYEGMPNALLEAMAMGLPCISTDCPCGGPKDIFSTVGQEYLVAVNDANSLSVAIHRMLTMENKTVNALSQNIKEHALSFKGDVVFEKWNKVISVERLNENKRTD